MDVLIFAGQSNMVGVTECEPEDKAVVENDYEYRFSEDRIVPLSHPVGEDLFNKTIHGSVEGRGSLVPSFCREYTEKTGRQVVAIHAAAGGSQISQWLPGTPIYCAAKKKILAGLRKIKTEYEVEHVYFVWLQGESDALCRVSEEKYIERLVYHKNVWKKNTGLRKFCLIRVGYFAKTAPWAKADPEEKMKWDEVIMGAQDKAPSVDGDFVMLTGICKELSSDISNFNMQDIGHYNNAALDKIGRAAGRALAEIAMA